MYNKKFVTAAASILLLLVIVSLATPVAYAATACTIMGYVNDENGNPIDGATVSVGSISRSTGGDGIFQISDTSFEPGHSYTVTASKGGYDSSSQTVTVDNGSKRVDFRLSKVVPATPTPIPATPTPTPAPTAAPTSKTSSGDPASYSSDLVVIATPTVTPMPNATVTITPMPNATATPTATPVPLVTAQTSPDLTWLLFLLLLLIAFAIGYLAGRKHEQMKQNDKEQKKEP